MNPPSLNHRFVGQMAIPAKMNAPSEGKPNGSPARSRSSERSDAGSLMVKEVFGFVKRNLSEAERRKSTTSGEVKGRERGAALVPAQRWSNSASVE